MISGIGVGGQHFRLGLLQIFWKMLNSIVTIVSYTRTSSSVWLFSMSHFTWLASLDMYLNSHNFRKPSRLILKCSYEFLKCSKEFECPACGKHRDATSWSFPTEAGDLLGQSRALMHILTWSSPIVHELFNGSSEYNEQPYSGEKCLPCPRNKPKTFCFPCSCSTTELRGWDNSTRNNYETCIAFEVTPIEGSQLWKVFEISLHFKLRLWNFNPQNWTFLVWG